MIAVDFTPQRLWFGIAALYNCRPDNTFSIQIIERAIIGYTRAILTSGTIDGWTQADWF